MTKSFSHLFIAVISSLLLCVSQVAKAEPGPSCVPTSNLDFGQVTIPANVIVGQVLATAALNYSIKCSKQGVPNEVTIVGLLRSGKSTGFPNVMDTGYPGIGIAFTYQGSTIPHIHEVDQTQYGQYGVSGPHIGAPEVLGRPASLIGDKWNSGVTASWQLAAQLVVTSSILSSSPSKGVNNLLQIQAASYDPAIGIRNRGVETTTFKFSLPKINFLTVAEPTCSIDAAGVEQPEIELDALADNMPMHTLVQAGSPFIIRANCANSRSVINFSLYDSVVGNDGSSRFTVSPPESGIALELQQSNSALGQYQTNCPNQTMVSNCRWVETDAVAMDDGRYTYTTTLTPWYVRIGDMSAAALMAKAYFSVVYQ